MACVTFQNTAKKYETSTGRSHRFIPEISQLFDCRVKAVLHQDSLNKDVVIKEEQFKTNYNEHYPRKTLQKKTYTRGDHVDKVDYVRNTQEKFFKKLVPPLGLTLSEMKSSYGLNCLQASDDGAVKPPTKTSKCWISKEGFEQQPSIPAHGRGYWKYTDPYLTSYTLDYNGNYDDVDPKIKSKMLTFHNAKDFEIPTITGNKTVFDKKVFGKVLPLRILWQPVKRVPNFGMTSEKQENYRKQTYSELYPYLKESCTHFPDSLSPASNWQTEAPPGMYCTEYCTYGRGAVRRIVDPVYPKREIHKTTKCTRI